jgi:tRNA(His) guanylyltransferase
MSSDSSALGDRMKGYEATTRYVLPGRTYTIIRVDGRAFHSLLRRADKPFDHEFMAVMDETAAALCREVSGTVLSYQHSDEISLLVTDFGSVHTEAWFGGGVQKMASSAASVATVEFNYRAAAFHSPLVKKIPNFMGTFDGRVFTIPSAVEVANYFLWRQRDCVRNSVSMAAQAHFPHKQLHGLNGAQMQELLWSGRGVNWNDYPDGAKRGRICQRITGEEDVTYTDKRSGEEVATQAVRSHWVSEAAPHFTAEPGSFLAEVIPSLPSLDRERVDA